MRRCSGSTDRTTYDTSLSWPVTLLLDLLFALALAACSNAADSVDRSVAASDSDQKLRTEVAVVGAEETTVGVAAATGEKGDPSGVPFRTRPEASGGSSYEADAVLGSDTVRTRGTNGWSWISAPAIDPQRLFPSGPS
jgi:hypothetical protein